MKDSDVAQREGDLNLARGVGYERVIRMLWLLDLRETDDYLEVAAGEDAKITQNDGRIIYRQAKTRQGRSWNKDDTIPKFVINAYRRFLSNKSTIHEFITNQPFTHSWCIGNKLNSANKRVIQIAPDCTAEFCKNVRFVTIGSSNIDYMISHLKFAIRKAIDASFPGCQISNFLRYADIDKLTDRLLMIEANLWSEPNIAVKWDDIEVKLGFDKLISDLYCRSTADGTLTPFYRYNELGPDNEMKIAISAHYHQHSIERSFFDEILESINIWFSKFNQNNSVQERHDYKVILLVGSHGTGKTWSLAHCGCYLSSSFPDVHVYIAGFEPPIRPFTFSETAISRAGPAVIIIDDLLPDWRGPVTSINYEIYQPLLIIGSAATPFDASDIHELHRRLGGRLTIVEIPDTVNSVELGLLSKKRGISLSISEKERARATNIRHVSQFLSGDVVGEHLASIKELIEVSSNLEILGPLLFCTSYRVVIPETLYEKVIGRAPPQRLKPWIVKSDGFYSYEDPNEAFQLLSTLGHAQIDRLVGWCSRLIERADSEQPLERRFVRHLLVRLSRTNRRLCNQLIDECQQQISKLVSNESLCAMVFAWLPILSSTQRPHLFRLAFSKVRRLPESQAEFALLVEAYGMQNTTKYLTRLLEHHVILNAVTAAQFVKSIMILPETSKRVVANRLTNLLIDMPMRLFKDTLNQKNCFEQAISLASDFGRATVRLAFLYRIQSMIDERLDDCDTIPQGWFTVYRKLTERVIMQSRSGLSIQIFRSVFIEGNLKFDAESRFQECFNREQAYVHRSIVNLGISLFENAISRSDNPLPAISGRLIPFTASFGDDSEWENVANLFLQCLESIALKRVAFDRISGIVMAAFPGMRRGPQRCCERFLRAALSWIPNRDRIKTIETGRLILRTLEFATSQQWLDKTIRDTSQNALLELVCGSDDTQNAFVALYRACGLDEAGQDLGRMPKGWEQIDPIVNTIIQAIGNIKWDAGMFPNIADLLINKWRNQRNVQQNLTKTLIKLDSLKNAEEMASNMMNEHPYYPDPLGYLAVINAKKGDVTGSRKLLSKIEDLRYQHGRGPHPPVIAWAHRELASVTRGRHSAMHVLCAELVNHQRLRSLEEVYESIGYEEAEKGSMPNTKARDWSKRWRS